MSDATTVLFGLPGARVERVERRSDGTRVVDVITDEPTAAACPSCGGGLDISEGIRGYLTERSTLWRRPHHGALEQNSLAMPRRLLQAGAVHRGHHPGTCPASAARCGCVGRWPRRSGMRPARWAEVAQADAVSWPTAHRAFVAYAETGIDRAVAHPSAGR